MIDLEEVRRRWEEEKPLYKELSRTVRETVKEALWNAGIKAEVTCRVKYNVGILKKTLQKRYSGDPLDHITDKAGVRVIVFFVSDIEPVGDIIQQTFVVKKRDDKNALLGDNKVGYASIHFDVTLDTQDPGHSRLADRICEIQVRTLCQHAWAEIEHTFYKSSVGLSPFLARQINCLSALFEVADREFEDVYACANELPDAWINKIVSLLEQHYLPVARGTYDQKLTIEVVEHLQQFWGTDPQGFIDDLSTFLDQNKEKVRVIFRDFAQYPDRHLFFSQPEGLLLVFLLERKKMLLRHVWEQQYPFEELEKVASNWGAAYSLE